MFFHSSRPPLIGTVTVVTVTTPQNVMKAEDFHYEDKEMAQDLAP